MLKGCSGSETCRTIGECALRFSPDQLNGKSCTNENDNGAEGLCCSDLTSNSGLENLLFNIILNKFII